MSEIRLIVKDVNESNRLEKFSSAVESLAKALYIPHTIKPRERDNGEKYVYESQGDLVKKWTGYVAETFDSVYFFLVRVLDLPMVTTFSKAIWDGMDERPVSEAISYRGKIIFNPETGKPIYREDFDKIIKAIEKFLNKRLDPAAKKVVLDSVSLGRVLAKNLLKMSPEEVRKLRLKDASFAGKNVEWISENLKWVDQSMGKLDADERERMKQHYEGITDFVDISEQFMGNHITKLKESLLFDVRDTIIGGVMQRKTRGEIAQDLFDGMGDLNRDWDRIVDTEVVNMTNTAFLRESVANEKPGEAVYFRRVEMRDQFVCKYCDKIRGKIVRWVNVPLSDESINDPHADTAIWDGKTNVGRKAADYWTPIGAVHPRCRGSWERWFPGMER